MLSFIVPVYNVEEEFFRACMDSLICQTCEEREIIVIDDGSTGNCPQICDEYGKHEACVKVIHQKNQGVSVARNRGLDLAQGDWITFVDADDWIEADMTRQVLEKVQSLETDILVYPPYVHKKGEMFKHPFYESEIARMDDIHKRDIQLRTMVLDYPNSLFHSKALLMGHTFGKVIRRKFLDASGIRFEKELTLQQDGVFYINLFEVCSRISYYNAYLYHYRLYDTSSHMKKRNDTDIIFNKVQNHYCKFIVDNQKPQQFYDAFFAKCITDLSVFLKNDFFNEAFSERLTHRLRRLENFITQEPYKTAIGKCKKEYLSQLKRRNLFYFKHKLLLLLWIDWKLYGITKG